jgi:hypothetical protein
VAVEHTEKTQTRSKVSHGSIRVVLPRDSPSLFEPEADEFEVSLIRGLVRLAPPRVNCLIDSVKEVLQIHIDSPHPVVPH